MKAIVIAQRGSPDGLQLHEVERPTPGDKEMLIKVHAATVTAGDIMLRKLPFVVATLLHLFMGIKKKKTPGHEFSGMVEAVGKDIRQFKVGDEVFGTTTGLTVGANAQYLCLPEAWKQGVIVHKPAGVTHEDAAALPVGGMTALYLLRKGKIQRGQNVLIYGASGSVGSYAVQLAKHFGATVTGVASTSNVEVVKSLGADQVIDYKKEDLTRHGADYDLIFDAVGKLSSAHRKQVLKPNGVFVSVRSITHESKEGLNFLKELLEAGKIRPLIDKIYPLDQTAEAHRYVETGRKRGNVVITIPHADGSQHEQSAQPEGVQRPIRQTEPA